MARLKMTILSLTCCNPKLASYDEKYMQRIDEALERLGLEADVSVVTATDALFGTGVRLSNVKELWDLLEKYGTSVAPLLIIDGEIAFYGGIPSMDKLLGAIENASKKGL